MQQIKFEWDENKNQNNIKIRDIDFNIVKNFDFQSALIIEDIRYDYGEKRYSAIGYITSFLYVLIFSYRNNAIRVISLRRANKKERIKYYEKK
ncbi:MAG: BrnT family toxin [Gammaproteobacteria bacterium]|nr:MAG: BrnT family toxin [Gammaproteobacteria bacterium]